MGFDAAGDCSPARPRAKAAGKTTSDVSLIYLFLHGGLSTIDTWDMKPDAPAEFRGEFKPIDTNVPGIQHRASTCRRLRRQMDKFSLIRSFRHHNSDHGPADHYMLTGYFPQAGFNPEPDAEQPAAGARLDHRPQARAARLGAALRLPAQAAPQLRLGLPRRRGRAVRHRRRPERARLRRARHGAAAGARRRPARRPQASCSPGRPLPARRPRPRPTTPPRRSASSSRRRSS